MVIMTMNTTTGLAEADSMKEGTERGESRNASPGGVAPEICHPLSRAIAIFLLLLSTFGICARPAAAQIATAPAPQERPLDQVLNDLDDFLRTPAISGYESQLAATIRAKNVGRHPVTDNLGDVMVTIGSGSPRRLIVTPIDEAGFVVSQITDDGYLRLQRLPQSGLPPVFNALYSAQPVKVGTKDGQWINGVVAGISVHLHRTGETVADSSNIENMYVDIGATSAAEVRKAGVDLLSPVALNNHLRELDDDKGLAGAAVGNRACLAAVMFALFNAIPSSVDGSLTFAFVVQQQTGARGLERILSTNSYDEMIYVGQLTPDSGVPEKGMRRAPRREPGSGVLLGLAQTGATLSGFAGDLQKLAETEKIAFATDYSADIIPRSDLPSPPFPEKWAHLGIATAWPDTPAETVSGSDVMSLVSMLSRYVSDGRRNFVSFGGRNGRPPLCRGLPISGPCPEDFPWLVRTSGISGPLGDLVKAAAASGHEEPVRKKIREMLPAWAKPETDDQGNLVLRVGSVSAATKAPKILVVAHMDEIGFEVKSIAKDGRLECETLGGMDLSFYEGHPMLVHTSVGDREAIMELPDGWDEPNFRWPPESQQTVRLDVGARNPEAAAALGIKVGDSITIPKEYRPLLGTRANGRSFDDRVGDTALIAAAWALGGPLKDRDVTFVWSTREELGLLGAGALAKRLAAEGRTPDYVFAIDTVVSSDSPLESKRFADVQLGRGFAIRAIDNSNIDPGSLVDRLERLARANQIPYQVGITGGGNDGAMFVAYGSRDVAIGWPLRYSHSPAEVIDTRDVDALARIVAVIARSW